MFKFYNLLFLFLTLNAFCSTHQSKREFKTLYIIFVQSDMSSSQSKPEIEKFQTIWNKHINRFISKIQRMDNYAILIYPLNHNTKNAEILLEFNSSMVDTLFAFERYAKIDSFLVSGRIKHASMLRNNRNPQQDIINSVAVLESKKDVIRDTSNYNIINLIYISDMIHYNTMLKPTDSVMGLFNFNNSYSFDMFERNVKNGFLYGTVEKRECIPHLINISNSKGQVLNVYSISFPLDDKISHEVSTAKILDVWRTLFKELGASTIKLNLSSVDEVLSRN